MARQRASASIQQQQRPEYKPRPRKTLEEVREQTPFPSWTGFCEPAALRGSRRIIRELIDALIEWGQMLPSRLDLMKSGTASSASMRWMRSRNLSS